MLGMHFQLILPLLSQNTFAFYSFFFDHKVEGEVCIHQFRVRTASYLFTFWFAFGASTVAYVNTGRISI